MNPLTSVNAAIAYRDALLDKALVEAWPTSDVVGGRLGADTSRARKELAAKERALEQLLGVWSAAHRTFFYPPFQFAPDGTVHPRVRELLHALGQNPAFAHSADLGGWERLDWMYQPRGSLSERSLVEAASSTGIAERECLLDNEVRTPADVFPVAPDAVIALAVSDVALVLDEL